MKPPAPPEIVKVIDRVLRERRRFLARSVVGKNKGNKRIVREIAALEMIRADYVAMVAYEKQMGMDKPVQLGLFA